MTDLNIGILSIQGDVIENVNSTKDAAWVTLRH